MNKVIITHICVCATFVLSGCGNLSNLAKGSIVGGSGGFVLGAGVGALNANAEKSAQ